MKLLLDTDVLLDVALGRERFGPDSKAVLDWCHAAPRSAFLAWHTIANTYYLLRPTTGDRVAREFISQLLLFVDVVRGGGEAVRRALALRMRDFEDALQVAAAMSEDAQYIITRNTADYRGSVVPVLTPRDFLARFVEK